jgi:hypothetical protein
VNSDPSDPPNDALARFMSRQEEYLDNRTPMYTAEEIATLREAAGATDAPSLDEERVSGVVLAQKNSGGEWRYPQFQFEPSTGTVKPVVASINQSLREDDPIGWWLRSSRALSARPIDVLATGRLAKSAAMDILTAESTAVAGASGSSPTVEVQWVQDALRLRIGDVETTVPWKTGWRLLLDLTLAFADSAHRPVLPEFWRTVNQDAERRCDETTELQSSSLDQPVVYCGELDTRTSDIILSSLAGGWQKMWHLLGADVFQFDVFFLAVPRIERR